jgi:NAD(P)-dependent dehydrogenase (short-subunit alcohol dehydrogenase family)
MLFSSRYAWRGKNALLTGGARGLGLELARILVTRGANVALVARDEDEIARALHELGQLNATAKLVGVPSARPCETTNTSDGARAPARTRTCATFDASCLPLLRCGQHAEVRRCACAPRGRTISAPT